MNWGNKLILIFLAFGGMISYMVYRCMQTPVDLVAKEYYRDELVYQDVLDETKKANELKDTASLHQQAAAIVLQLPEEMKNTAVKGSILFYCPSGQAKDRRIPLSVDTAARQEIGAGVVLPGHYRVKIEWESRGVKYFTEQPFVIL